MRAVAIVVLLGQTGCVAFPFAVPPARVEVGTGFRHVDGEAKTADPPPRVGVQAKPTTDHPTNDHPIMFAAGIHPLGFGRDLLARHIDVGVGYLYRGGPAARIQGGYLEGDGYIGALQLTEDNVFRVGVRVRLEMLAERGVSRFGRGATFGGILEIAQFTNGAFESSNSRGGIFGVSTGESGIGIAIDGGYAQVDEITVTSITGSVVIRIPILAGFLYEWAWELGKK